jgi:ankyrin repeat protein
VQRREFIKQVGAAAPLLATGGILEIGSQASRYPFFEEFLANCSDARRIFLSSIIRSRNLPLFKKWQESGVSLDMEPWDHAIYEAASVGWLDGVQMLLDSGVDVNRADKWFGWTPLISAAEGNHPIVMKHLIDRGADVNAPDIEGHTSLHAVAWQKFGLQSARLLIDHGADLNLKDDGGVTPLSVAIKNSN